MIKISKNSIWYTKSFGVQSSHKYPTMSFLKSVAKEILEKIGLTNFEIVDDNHEDPNILDFELVASKLIWKRKSLLLSDDIDAIIIMARAVDKNTRLLGYSLLISGLTASDCETIHHSSDFYYNMTDKKVVERIKAIKSFMKHRVYFSFRGPVTQVFLELGMASERFYD